MKTITIPRKLANSILADAAVILGEATGRSYAGRGCCNPASLCRLADALGYHTSDPEMNAWIKKNRRKLEKMMEAHPGEFRDLGHAAAVLHTAGK